MDMQTARAMAREIVKEIERLTEKHPEDSSTKIKTEIIAKSLKLVAEKSQA